MKGPPATGNGGVEKQKLGMRKEEVDFEKFKLLTISRGGCAK
jgi:hypothetical protein